MQLKTEEKLLGLSEGDIIEYIPTGQLGIISKVHYLESGDQFQLKLMSPDQKLWAKQADIKLLCPVG